MKCEVCKQEKPERQEYHQVNGELIALPCRECFAKAKTAYDAADKGPQYRHTKSILKALKEKNK